MIAVGHSSVGVLVGVSVIAVVNPSTPLWVMMILALVTAVISHYACDFVPHGHYYIDDKNLTARSIGTLFLDFIGGVILLLGLATRKYGLGPELVIIMSAMFGALAPDMFESSIKLKLIPKIALVKREMAFHGAMHWHDEPTSPLPHGARPIRWTDLWQLAMFIVAIYALIF